MALVSLAGCEQPPPGGTSLFPLDEGRSWTYAEETLKFGVVERANRTVENLGQATLHLNDETRLPNPSLVARCRLLPGRGCWPASFRKGLRTFIEEAPREDLEPRYVLRLPLREGSNWTQDTHPLPAVAH